MAAKQDGLNFPELEPAGELKIGQVGIANLRVKRLDAAQLQAEMAERVQRAPKLFDRGAVVVDFGELSVCPSAAQALEVIEALKQAGALPVALAYGTKQIEELSVAIGLPLLAKFRTSYERAEVDSPAPVQQETPPVEPEAPSAERAASPEPGTVHTTPVRSGQQIYAQNRDLTICASVGAGAEVLADGSIHVYGPLRGRALAGASGATHVRIFCSEFHAELVAIAGNYKVLEELPKDLRGKAVQIWLDETQTLQIAALN